MNDTSWVKDMEHMTQIKCFAGLKWGTGFPTDIDGYMEWKNRAHVFFELKSKNAFMSKGQELAYVRLVDDLSKVKPTLFIEAWHIEPQGEQIDCATAIVKRYYFGGKWSYPKNTHLRKVIDNFLRKYGGMS